VDPRIAARDAGLRKVAIVTTAAAVLGAAAVGAITYGLASTDTSTTSTSTTTDEQGTTSGDDQLQAPDVNPGLGSGRAQTGSGAS
jgi:hypothetical protein